MGKELDAILDHGDAQPAASSIGDNGYVSYLKQVICPIYETMPKIHNLLFNFVYQNITHKYMNTCMRQRTFSGDMKYKLPSLN
ncbi:hypothetical protein MKW94_010820 [Papaver nudicaule]|uniref:Uncharacterized protein n=1 Tax=Papaver nudicaule TaxID=74823 RepID=A0AA41SCW3_PAPNU|nr:hypothetical protein [Papaver nudicaule]